jgi:hypothetical protein
MVLNIGPGLLQPGTLNGVAIGGGFFGKINGVVMGPGHVSFKTNGLMIGLLINEVVEMNGLQLSGYANIAGVFMRGIQVALLGNLVSGDESGDSSKVAGASPKCRGLRGA